MIGARLDLNFIERMFIIPGTVVRRMRFEECNKEDKWFPLVTGEKIAGMSFEKLRFAQVPLQMSGKTPADTPGLLVRLQASRDEELRVVGKRFFVAARAKLFRVAIFGRNPFFEAMLR